MVLLGGGKTHGKFFIWVGNAPASTCLPHFPCGCVLQSFSRIYALIPKLFNSDPLLIKVLNLAQISLHNKSHFVFYRGDFGN